MHAKKSSGRTAVHSHLPATDSVLSSVVPPVPNTPDKGLPAAFASALGKNAGAGNGPIAGLGNEKTPTGGSWPGQINKASKPVAGANSAPPRRSGHR